MNVSNQKLLIFQTMHKIFILIDDILGWTGNKYHLFNQCDFDLWTTDAAGSVLQL